MGRNSAENTTVSGLDNLQGTWVGNRIERREVKTGLFDDDSVEIKGGLTEGEEVLLNPMRWAASEPAEEQVQTKQGSE
jgi:hypothetical protein